MKGECVCVCLSPTTLNWQGAFLVQYWHLQPSPSDALKRTCGGEGHCSSSQCRPLTYQPGCILQVAMSTSEAAGLTLESMGSSENQRLLWRILSSGKLNTLIKKLETVMITLVGLTRWGLWLCVCLCFVLHISDACVPVCVFWFTWISLFGLAWMKTFPNSHRLFCQDS